MMYGSENWSLNRSDKRKIEAAEIRFLRFNINDKLMQYKINWREHIQRMDGNRLPKKI